MVIQRWFGQIYVITMFENNAGDEMCDGTQRFLLTQPLGHTIPSVFKKQNKIKEYQFLPLQHVFSVPFQKQNQQSCSL